MKTVDVIFGIKLSYNDSDIFVAFVHAFTSHVCYKLALC